MILSLKIRNIVLVGAFNPMVFDKYFFIKNQIVKEDEILVGSVFGTLGGMQLVSNKFNIIISLKQIIISATKSESNEDEISKIILSIIEAGKIVNVTAMGINFHWFLEETSKTLEEISKHYFYNDKLKLFSKFFNADNSMFGVYASTNFKDSRLKLDVKPNKLQDIIKKTFQEEISFAFNFHFDIKNQNDNLELIKYLNDYNSYRKESDRIISIYK